MDLYHFYKLIFLLIFLLLPRFSIAKTLKPVKSKNPLIEIAKQQYRQGIKNYENQNYAKALKNFLKSYALSSKKALLFNIAMCNLKLKNLTRALKFFDFYLKYFPKDTDALLNRKSILQQFKNTFVKLNGGVIGAKVFINGIEVGNLPIKNKIPVNPQSIIKIIVKKEGYYPYIFSVKISPHSTIQLAVSMIKKPSVKKKKIIQVLKPKQKFTHNLKKNITSQNKPKQKSSQTLTPDLWVISSGILSLAVSAGLYYASYKEQQKSDNTTDAVQKSKYARAADNYLFDSKLTFASGIALIVSGAILKLTIFKSQSNNRKIAFVPAFSSNMFLVKFSLVF